MSPIKITINGDFKKAGRQSAEFDCDDAIIVFSTINGAVMGAAKNGDPSFTRDVSAWVGGFDSTSELYTRLSQGVLQLFIASDNDNVNQLNLVNLIQFLIANGGLTDKVRLSVNEELFSPGKEQK